jgi:hypothetical protein
MGGVQVADDLLVFEQAPGVAGLPIIREPRGGSAGIAAEVVGAEADVVDDVEELHEILQ